MPASILLLVVTLVALLAFPHEVLSLSSIAQSASIPSADQLRTLALASSRKVPGSTKYSQAWRHWSTLTIRHIRHELRHNHLPYPVDLVATKDLQVQLGVAADIGVMPSFSDPTARSGYALGFFGRALLAADVLAETANQPAFLAEGLSKLSCSDNGINLVSIGGGPGYDFVGAAIAASFQNAATTKTSSIHATVLDYEEGWYDLVDGMSLSTGAALSSFENLSSDHTCSFGGKCDITQPLSHPSNQICLKAAASANLYICQYCVAENAARLRETDYVFFANLLDTAEEGALFVFTETTHRLWPEFVELILPLNGFEVAFLRAGRGKGGWQMVLQKKRGATINEDQLELCEEFRRDGEMHKRKLRNGHVRQTKKIRGKK